MTERTSEPRAATGTGIGPVLAARFVLVAVLAVGSIAFGCIAVGCGVIAIGPESLAASAASIPIENRIGLPPNALEATVTRVVDGDTLVVQIGQNTETIRLLGIDTPEKPGGPRPAECYGQEATDFTSEILPVGIGVLLARDAEPRDLYGRLLAYVYRSEDGLFINLTVIEHGAAVPFSIAPNTTFDDIFDHAGAEARRNGHGLWGQCGNADTVLVDE